MDKILCQLSQPSKDCVVAVLPNLPATQQYHGMSGEFWYLRWGGGFLELYYLGDRVRAPANEFLEYANKGAAREDVVHSLFATTIDVTPRVLQDVLPGQVCLEVDPSLGQDPAKELHSRWRKVVPDEREGLISVVIVYQSLAHCTG